MVQTLIETTFNTHVYRWAGKVYKQRKGGPIGLRASGSLAKAAMEDWISRFENKLGKLGIKVHLIRKLLGASAGPNPKLAGQRYLVFNV